jgi:hypothetical protein
MTARELARREYVRYLQAGAPGWDRLQPFIPRARRFSLASLSVIADAPVESLLDVNTLERELVPATGLRDAPTVFPPELLPAVGTGVQCFQYPNQFAPYLRKLAACDVRSYLEIGVERGGSFLITTAYLRRFRRLASAVAVDIFNAAPVMAFAARHDWARFERLDSAGDEFKAFLRGRRFNLAFIDGDHAEAAVRRDFATIRDHADLIAFHDIVDAPSPGVGLVWQEVRGALAHTHEFFEYTAQYPEVTARLGRRFLGIGLAVPQAFPADPRVPPAD